MKSWLLAARLRTLPLSLSGIFLGAFLALSAGYWSWNIFILSCLTTILFQVLSNFANDYGDGVKGTDNVQRVGPKRAIQSGAITKKQMYTAIIITAILALLSTITLIFVAFGQDNLLYLLIFLLLGIASIMAAIYYTMGKKPYGYAGFGDLFVFIFFGWVGVLGSYFLYVKCIDATLFLPASAIGLLSTAVLNLNNLRDHQNDATSSKNTLVVKLGFRQAKKYHVFLCIMPFFLTSFFILTNSKSWHCFLFLILLIPIIIHLKKVLQTTNPALLDSELKKIALLTLSFALILGSSLILIQ